MSANGAHSGRFFTHYEVTAVTAFPHRHFAFFEYCLHLNVVKKRAISFLVSLFDSCNHSELSSECLESLFLSLFGECIVHICPLVVFAFSSCEEVLSCVTELAERLEPKLSVLLLVVCRCFKNSSDLLVAFFFSYRCKISVFVSRLRFACERSPKIFLCFCSFKIHFVFSLTLCLYYKIIFITCQAVLSLQSSQTYSTLRL